MAILERSKAGIDLLLTDVVMPEMSGLELATRVQRLGNQTPLLFISGSAGARLVDQRLLIEKPFTKETLLSRVDRALRASRHANSAVFPALNRHDSDPNDATSERPNAGSKVA